MKIILGLIVIAICVAIGWSYGKKLLRESNTVRYSDRKYQIFIYKEGEEEIKRLFNTCINAYHEAGIVEEYRFEDQQTGCITVHFEDGDIIELYRYGAPMRPLSQTVIQNSIVRIFFDCMLPDSAIRATIDAFGLRGYMFGFGLTKGENYGKIN